MNEVTTLIEKIGEVQLLKELTAHFQQRAEDGLIRTPEERARIEALLLLLHGCIDWASLYEPVESLY